MTPISAPLQDFEPWFAGIPGTDRFLVSREDLTAWVAAVAAASDRIHVEPIGQSTEGRDMHLLTISSPDTIRALDEVRNRRNALTDDRLLVDPSNVDGQLAGDKPVVLITAGIHADEVGGVQLMPELIASLALSSDERVRHLLDQVIVLIVPTLNPDGMDLVGDWYRRTLGTAAEGTDPPSLYHRYAGHDNNRDWYTHHLAETRNIIDYVRRPWRPHVLLDLHEMGEYTARYFLPPYIEPAEPHVHPLLLSATSSLGAALVTEHHRQGHRGVVSGVLFDSYSPSRTYQTYHGGVRILAEAASVRIASPSTVEPGQMIVRRGFDPRVRGLRNPIPWAGGTWRLRDIMDYHLTTIHALLDEVSRQPDQWLRDQWTMVASEVTRPDAPMYAIAPIRQQVDPAAALDLVRTLEHGDVRVEAVDESDNTLSKGTLVVRTNQPFGSFASTLLDFTPYPEPEHTPYDVTSHALPIHLGVQVSVVESSAGIATRPLRPDDRHPFSRPTASDASGDRWLAIDPRSHASIRLVAHALRNGAVVRRLTRSHFDSGSLLQPGAWLIADDHVSEIMSLASELSVRTWSVRPIAQGTDSIRMPAIGLYVPWSGESVDTGWLRLMLEHSGMPYEIVHDSCVRSGDLSQFDVLLFAHQTGESLVNGPGESTYPAEYSGGIGAEGIRNLEKWAASGGSIVAIGGTFRTLASQMALPVRVPLESRTAGEYSCPGAVVRVVPDGRHSLMLGIEDPFPVMLEGDYAMEIGSPDKSASIAARFGDSPSLLSGWMRGAGLVQNLGAIMETPIGSGCVVGFAFRPHFRTQMLASYAPLINAIMRAGQVAEEGQTG
jgi:hypothetical protein